MPPMLKDVPDSPRGTESEVRDSSLDDAKFEQVSFGRDVFANENVGERNPFEDADMYIRESHSERKGSCIFARWNDHQSSVRLARR